MVLLRYRSIWLLVFISVFVCLLLWLPARWVTAWLQTASKGHVELIEVAGTVWEGSAQLSISPISANLDPSTQEGRIILPERLSWRLYKSPLLLGRLEGNLHFGKRPESIFKASFQSWSLAAGATALPAAKLTALGAPLNSLAPGGWVELNWQELTGTPSSIKGQIEALWSGATTKLSGSETLGDYLLTLRLEKQTVQLDLKTQRGRLHITGQGQFGNGVANFRLVSKSADQHQEALSAVLNMLGRRQNDEYILQIGS